MDMGEGLTSNGESGVVLEIRLLRAAAGDGAKCDGLLTRVKVSGLY